MKRFQREGFIKMLAHDLGNRPGVGRSSGDHVIQSRSKRVDVRTDINIPFFQLFRTGKMRSANKSPTNRQCA